MFPGFCSVLWLSMPTGGRRTVDCVCPVTAVVTKSFKPTNGVINSSITSHLVSAHYLHPLSVCLSRNIRSL